MEVLQAFSKARGGGGGGTLYPPICLCWEWRLCLDSLIGLLRGVIYPVLGSSQEGDRKFVFRTCCSLMTHLSFARILERE